MACRWVASILISALLLTGVHQAQARTVAKAQVAHQKKAKVVHVKSKVAKSKRQAPDSQAVVKQVTTKPVSMTRRSKAGKGDAVVTRIEREDSAGRDSVKIISRPAKVEGTEASDGKTMLKMLGRLSGGGSIDVELLGPD